MRNGSTLLYFTSLVFTTNILSAFYNDRYLYSLLFFILTVTSLIYHSNKTGHTEIADKVTIGTVISYGSYVLLTSASASAEKYALISGAIGCFLSCAYLYGYGSLTRRYCFDSDIDAGDRYHALLHLMSSLGHHCIIFL
jgi:hypothetical protein